MTTPPTARRPKPCHGQPWHQHDEHPRCELAASWSASVFALIKLQARPLRASGPCCGCRTFVLHCKPAYVSAGHEPLPPLQSEPDDHELGRSDQVAGVSHGSRLRGPG